jgi:phage shock protein PspC (stress-responsive transcriptional regulator)
MDDETPPTDPQATPPPEPDPPPQPPPGPKRLERSGSDRMVSGVCGGIARYLGVDATLVRIVAVALAVVGGTGLVLYLAALLLMPEEGATAPLAGGNDGRGKALAVLGVVVLACIGVAVVGALIGWVLVPVGVLAAAGLFAWWIASGERPSGTPRQILMRAGLGVGLLLICLALAVAGGWAAAAGSGAVGAALVIGAGVVLVAAAFMRPARWLILPALSLGLAAAFVIATGIELDGGVGDRQYQPTTATDVQSSYKLGIGQMVVDLRDAHLPPGDRHVDVKMGIGHAVVLVAPNVCVTTDAQVGVGAANSFDAEDGGIDVNHTDAHSAPAGTPRVVLHGDVGVGMLDVHHSPWHGSDWRGHNDWTSFQPGGNDACVGGAHAGGDHHG